VNLPVRHNPSVVEEDVHLPEVFAGLPHHPPHISRLGNIAGNCDRSASSSHNLRRQRFISLTIKIYRGNLRSFLSKQHRTGASDSRCRTGDDRNFPFQAHR
jgi:hypothetical protein